MDMELMYRLQSASKMSCTVVGGFGESQSVNYKRTGYSVIAVSSEFNGHFGVG